VQRRTRKFPGGGTEESASKLAGNCPTCLITVSVWHDDLCTEGIHGNHPKGRKINKKRGEKKSRKERGSSYTDVCLRQASETVMRNIKEDVFW